MEEQFGDWDTEESPLLGDPDFDNQSWIEDKNEKFISRVIEDELYRIQFDMTPYRPELIFDSITIKEVSQ